MNSRKHPLVWEPAPNIRSPKHSPPMTSSATNAVKYVPKQYVSLPDTKCLIKQALRRAVLVVAGQFVWANLRGGMLFAVVIQNLIFGSGLKYTFLQRHSKEMKQIDKQTILLENLSSLLANSLIVDRRN